LRKAVEAVMVEVERHNKNCWSYHNDPNWIGRYPALSPIAERFGISFTTLERYVKRQP
jgi:hypothetical protein